VSFGTDGAHGDFNGGGVEDIAPWVNAPSRLVARSITTGAIVATYDGDSNMALGTADSNGDGRDELLIARPIAHAATGKTVLVEGSDSELVGTPFAFGDESSWPCPCANGAVGCGCANSNGLSSRPHVGLELDRQARPPDPGALRVDRLEPRRPRSRLGELRDAADAPTVRRRTLGARAPAAADRPQVRGRLGRAEPRGLRNVGRDADREPPGLAPRRGPGERLRLLEQPLERALDHVHAPARSLPDAADPAVRAPKRP